MLVRLGKASNIGLGSASPAHRPPKAHSIDLLDSLLQPMKETEEPRRTSARLSHNVYVVELSPEVLAERKFRERNPGYVEGRPCVYVGMTGLGVSERFANHQRGHKGNRFVFRYGSRLLPELFAHLNPMPYEAAMTMERELADDLRQQGFGVWQA